MIRRLRQAKPDQPDALREEMMALMKADRALDALRAYKAYTDNYVKTGVPPARPSQLAVQILFERGNRAAARDLAAQLAKGTAQARWRNLAVMLTMDDDPHAALKLLPGPGSAGIIKTDMTKVVTAKYDKLIAEGLTPIPRWGLPEDIGRAVGAIAEGRLDFCTGQVINVDGGFHLRRL